jgi:nucleotide-binding universal stress UspA family protein
LIGGFSSNAAWRRSGLPRWPRGAPPGVAVETRVVEGKPEPALLDLIGELSPDLAVAGTHGVGLGRFLLGSVSQRLLERAPCDLLLFRGRAPLEGPLRVIRA